MTDEKVGGLWQKYLPWSGLHAFELQAARDIIALIRKLVAERVANEMIACQYHGVEINCDHLGVVLKDFGIPPESWKP